MFVFVFKFIFELHNTKSSFKKDRFKLRNSGFEFLRDFRKALQFSVNFDPNFNVWILSKVKIESVTRIIAAGCWLVISISRRIKTKNFQSKANTSLDKRSLVQCLRLLWAGRVSFGAKRSSLRSEHARGPCALLRNLSDPRDLTESYHGSTALPCLRTTPASELICDPIYFLNVLRGLILIRWWRPFHM